LAAGADSLVVFGISGDLAKKMTFQALYRLEVRGELDCRIIGVAIDEWDDASLRRHARDSVAATADGDVDERALDSLLGRLSYIQGDYAKPETFGAVKQAVGDDREVVYYLEIPPSLFGTVVRGLGDAGLVHDGVRVVVEKPFGHDLASARALAEELHQVLDESQLLRIDHFLGKEPVMDITYLRFANTILEPVWNSKYVDSVRITMAEDFGVEDRGAFYDAVGTLRDVVQNHLLQVLALVAMEPPSAGGSHDPIRDAKVDLFRAIPGADPGRYVRGQYEGYLDVEGVAPDSQTETFAALRLEVENWRWSGVPFFIRAGKEMPVEATEVRVVFTQPPRLGIGGRVVPDPDEFVIRIKPEPGAQLRVLAKKAGAEELEPVHLDLLFQEQGGPEPEPYERLLRDAIMGDPQLFPNQDAIEETWRIVQPLLDEPSPVASYQTGTWGPEAAGHLLHGHGGWRKPWMPQQPWEDVGAG
jgi:glucose-6-phosphate 1-dehydrogenase